ncbi:MAG: glycosyltransferase [Candidatus Nanoarchaeia archaeon]|nr:glycosyltransferase [Candidatus Nanoarchaeia archaeon]
MNTIVIPAHNEEKRIRKTLEIYGEFFKKKNFEILIVLNGCKDKTLDVVKKSEKKYKIIRHIEFKQAGKGFAIVEGFKNAIKRKSNLIGFVDADLATPPVAFFDLVKDIGESDGIIASRWMKKSIVKTKQSILRRITSRSFNFLVRSLLGLKFSDTQCGAKLFKAEALKEVVESIGTTKWAFDVDLLYRLKRKGYKIKEIPTTWEEPGKSHLSLLKIPFQMFSAILRLRLIHSPFNFIVRAYNKLPEKIKIHNL